MDAQKVPFQTVSKKVRDQGLRIPRKEAYLAQAAVTRDTRNADIGLFTKPSRLPKSTRCDSNSKIKKWKWGPEGKEFTR